MHYPSATCPQCGATFYAHAPIHHHAPPGPGDVSICARCGVIIAFDEDMALEVASQETLDSLDAETISALDFARSLVETRRAGERMRAS